MKSMMRYCIVTCLSVALFACADDMFITGQTPQPESSDKGIAITLSFPDMSTTATRALGESAPKLNELDIYLFVFDGNDLRQTIHIPSSETTWSNELANRVTFTAYLPQTDNKATIHIIAIDDKDRKFVKQIDDCGYGLEDIVMPSFSVSGDKDVYWQRVDLGCPIIVSKPNTDEALEEIKGTEEQVKAHFQHPIPLIRNFARVSLGATFTDDFQVLGWTVVNDLDASSVVPWYSQPNSSDVEFAKYADFGNVPVNIYSYDEVVKQGYQGVWQAGAKNRNTLAEVSKKGGSNWGMDPRYIYEHRITSVNPLYVLLYARFRGQEGYYKLALGHRDQETGLFTEYHVLRNIAYHIDITNVTTTGYKTPEEAASAPAFNNVSGDVVTRNLMQISDGIDILQVNAFSYVITQPGQELDFRYRYVIDIDQPGQRADRNDLVFYDTDNIGIAPGDVIESYTPAEDVTDVNGYVWKSVKIKVKDPTYDLKQQTFTIYSKPRGAATGGISRIINMILRKPWDFVRVETFPGLIADDKTWPDYNPSVTPDEDDVNYFIGPEKGAPLTIFFELPANLPEAIFPLSFTIESDRQNIENAGVGNAVVETGPSLFPGVTDMRIKFVKTVTWQEYTNDTGISSTPESRIIRARFVTTTAISSLKDDETITTVKVHNPYFNDGEDKFKRAESQPVSAKNREIYFQHE